jgi:cellulose synthase/poly-beta-1,6-N-acetylglucosamine synthase-like glycosyltransferase
MGISRQVKGVEYMISVIIPCQEDEILLFPTLNSIFKNQTCSQDLEVLLIRSLDFTVQEKVNQFPVKVFSKNFNGQAEALNYGVSQARGDLICTTKPGCIVSSDWLAEIDTFLKKNPKIDGVGGPVFPCWEYGTKTQKLASQIFHEEQRFPDSVIFLKLGKYQGLLHATNSAFRKEALKQLTFDESFSYDFDFDACWKMLRKGYRLAYNPKLKVQYIFPLSMFDLLNRYYCWGKDKVILRKKYFSGMDIKSYLYTTYNMVRALCEPSPLVSTKKLLRFVQHLAFNLGCIHG